jgi:NitT/TauT family transport system substrate-binding protein
MRKTTIGILAAAISAALTLPALALDKVKIGTSGNSIIWTIIEMGQEAKIWEALGIEAEHIALAGDAPMQQALASGSIEFGCGSGPAMGYRAKGVPALAVAALAGPPYSMTIAAPMNSPIKSFDDLKGKKIGITSAGSLSDWLVREVSRQKGWGPEGIEILPLGAERSRLAAMKAGDLDGTLVADQNAYSYEENGAGKMVLSFGDVVKDFHAHILFARDDLRAKNPDLVRRVVLGWFRTVAWMRAHRDQGIRIAAKTINVSEASVARAWDNELRMMSSDGAFNPAAIETIRRSLPELGMLDHAPDAASLFDGSFTPVKID